MDEKFKLLELELCKVCNQLDSLKGNDYSNPSLETYQENLFQLFDKISFEIHNKKNELLTLSAELDLLTRCLAFISLSVQFLEDSVFNYIPFETVFCLEKALKDWVDDELTIVTSLKKDSFGFDPSLSIDKSAIFQIISARFEINFSKKLIQIAIPKHDISDYFFSVVLYHELAHFIDMKYKISESILLVEYPDIEEEDEEKKLNHIREHFADLFCAQYIDDCFLKYLLHVAEYDGESYTHPSTGDRIDVVEDFISETPNDIVTQIIKATKEISNKEIKKRYSKLKSYDDFYNYIPPIIESDAQLHGLFIAGWDIWFNHREKIAEKNIIKSFKYLNNLIEKSISNYMVTTQWKTYYVSE